MSATSGVEDHRLLIRVIDAGCRIPPEQLEDVFEPLFSTKTFGAGLGLSIAKLKDLAVTGILTKPFDPAELLAAIDSLIGPGSGGGGD